MTVDHDEARDRQAVAAAAVDAGREAALSSFRTGMNVERKAHGMDRVTAADRESQERALAAIGERYPGEPAVAEESGEEEPSVPDDGAAWIVDPIDGTNNFAAGNRVWAVSVAGTVDGEPVTAVTDCPALGDRYAAADANATRNGEPTSTTATEDPAEATVATVFGLDPADRPAYVGVADATLRRFGDLRRLGSAQAVLAMVAAGELDGAVSAVELAPWDTVAGVHLVRTAGGRVTTLSGDRWRHDATGLAASNGDPRIHEALLAAADAGTDRP